MSTTHVAHHFDTSQQQFEAARLGTWLFLATEVLFFGGMFAGYMVYRILYPQAFIEGSSHLSIPLGTINTAVLLLSSLMMAMAVHQAESLDGKPVRYISGTILLGLVFLGIKAVEYSHKFHEHLVPGRDFGSHEGFHMSTESELFFSFYFAMTGMHALHMVIGVGLLAWIGIAAWRKQFSPQYYTPVEMVGLYWHFVDIVWVFLFPLLYLIG